MSYQEETLPIASDSTDSLRYKTLDMYDVAIIGAGPAGATLARLIGKKYRVVVLERRDLANLPTPATPASITKCCGGLLAPDAQRMIARLGMGIPRELLVDPQLFTVRTLDLDNHLERYYQRFYLNMDRERFDRYLASLIPAEAEVRYAARFMSFTETDSGYRVCYHDRRGEQSFDTKILVAADGGNSSIRKTAGSGSMPKQYVAIQEWYEANEPMPYFTAVFDRQVTDYYSWMIPKKPFLLLGSALIPQDDPKEHFNRLKSKLREMGFHFDRLVKKEATSIFRPVSIKQVCAGRANVAFIGEAAGAISPSSAEGISYAFRTALYLAESLQPGLTSFLKRYQSKLMRLKLNIALKNLKSPGMYHPFLRKMIMRSGVMSMHVN